MNRWTSLAAMACVLTVVGYANPGHLPGWYGMTALTLLVAKLAASLTHKPTAPDAAGIAKAGRLSVAVVVTVFNEDPATFAVCLDSLLAQTRLPNAVVVVDDGSPDRRVVALAHQRQAAFDEAGVDYQVIEFTENRGKRHALAAGFRLHPAADVYLGVDSDTRLDERAIAEGMLPFASRRVTAVTGLVLALNARKNILTRLIDLRYANAFLFERAAYSLLGSVLCCCGSLAFYRGHVVRANLDDFLSQRFLGVPATYGDDRRLTNYCLQAGKVVLQSSAVAWTLVPERMGHFLNQQARWSKSFFRESLWTIQQGRVGLPAFWLSLMELTSWLVFTGTLLVTLALAPFEAPRQAWLLFLMYSMILGYARSVRYLEAGQTRMGFGERMGTFLLAPLYGLLHMGLLLWVRLYALATLRDNGWGTRGGGVEVALAAPAPSQLDTLDDLLAA